MKQKLLPSQSPIQCLLIPENDSVKICAEKIQSIGFDVRPILSPTVPKGKERVRICIHAFNTVDEVKALATALSVSIG